MLVIVATTPESYWRGGPERAAKGRQKGGGGPISE
jgi:hypothetical protein